MSKYQITELVLIESRSARNGQISDVSDDRALETLNKAKALVMALWQGTGIASSKQLAEYFEISEEAVQKAYQRNRLDSSPKTIFINITLLTLKLAVITHYSLQPLFPRDIFASS